MYVQTKKVVIIFIVTIITFASVIDVLYKDVQSTVPQVSVVSSEELSYKVSFAQNIFNEFSIEGDDSADLAMYGASIYQIDQKSKAQLSNIVNGSDTIVIIGDTFNDHLEQLITDNASKQFVLVENSGVYDYDNVYQININYNSVYDSINRVSKNQKSVVVISDEISSLAETRYYEHEIATNGNVKLEVVSNASNVVDLKDKLNKDFAAGFTNVYSLNPYSTSTIIETINDYNNDLIKSQEDSKKSEVSSEETSSEQSDSEVSSEQSISEVSSEEVDSEQDENVEVPELPQVTLRYLSLNQADFLALNSNNQFSTYGYDASKNMTEVIDATLNEKLISKSELISITDNE